MNSVVKLLAGAAIGVLAFSLFAPSPAIEVLPAANAAPFLVHYGQQVDVYFPLFEPTGVDLVSITGCAQGGGFNDDDVQLSIDGAAAADSTNCFTAVTNSDGWHKLTLEASETQGKVVLAEIVDQSGTKLWLDQPLLIPTHGDDSAMYAMDFDWEGFLYSQGAIAYGTVDTGTTPATNQVFESDIITISGAYSDATVDQLVGAKLIFVTGNNVLERHTISGISQENGNEKITLSSPVKTTPVNGERFVIL